MSYKSDYYKVILNKIGLYENKVTDRPDYWCINGWTTCLKKMDVTCDVCFFGHSMIAMSNFQKYFPDKKIIEIGYPGDNIKGMQLRVSQIVAVHPKKVFVMAGTNSLSYSKTEFEQEYNKLITAIQDSLPQVKLHLFNIIPQNDGRLGNTERNPIVRERNIFIKNYSNRKKIPLIDLYTIYTDCNGALDKKYTKDGVHLVPEAYLLWTNAIRKYIEKIH